MYTKCTDVSAKEKIVTYFAQLDSRLQIVLATIAFGMSLESPPVHHHLRVMYRRLGELIEIYQYRL